MHGSACNIAMSTSMYACITLDLAGHMRMPPPDMCTPPRLASPFCACQTRTYSVRPWLFTTVVVDVAPLASCWSSAGGAHASVPDARALSHSDQRQSMMRLYATSDESGPSNPEARRSSYHVCSAHCVHRQALGLDALHVQLLAVALPAAFPRQERRGHGYGHADGGSARSHACKCLKRHAAMLICSAGGDADVNRRVAEACVAFPMHTGRSGALAGECGLVGCKVRAWS